MNVSEQQELYKSPLDFPTGLFPSCWTEFASENMPPFALYLIKHYFIDILERIGVNGKMNQNWSNTLSENYEKKIRVTKQHPKCTIEASSIDHHPILSGFPSWLFDPNGLDGSRFPTRMPNLTRPTRPTRPPFPTLSVSRKFLLTDRRLSFCQKRYKPSCTLSTSLRLSATFRWIFCGVDVRYFPLLGDEDERGVGGGGKW